MEMSDSLPHFHKIAVRENDKKVKSEEENQKHNVSNENCTFFSFFPHSRVTLLFDFKDDETL